MVASAAVVFATFLVLIQAWRYIVTAIGNRRLSFVPAARIWFVSNLSIYIPAGPGWQIVQMGVLSTEQGIGAVPATTAAVINAAINIACGTAVAVTGGAPLLASLLPGYAWLGWSAAIVAALGICALPVLLPTVFRIARDRFHRDVPLATPPARVILIAAAANVVAWFLYGVALKFLSAGLFGVDPGSVWEYTTAFAAAYVVGYLAFIFPGGIGVRELTLSAVLVAAGLAARSQASVLVVGSRLILIVVQVIPALLFLAYRRRPRHETNSAAG